MRASALRVRAARGRPGAAGRVELAEISGSDTFVHVDDAHRPNWWRN
jgi:glycerol transport system ATP-binding protein